MGDCLQDFVKKCTNSPLAPLTLVFVGNSIVLSDAEHADQRGKCHLEAVLLCWLVLRNGGVPQVLS
jgi:hypothetical protein